MEHNIILVMWAVIKACNIVSTAPSYFPLPISQARRRIQHPTVTAMRHLNKHEQASQSTTYNLKSNIYPLPKGLDLRSKRDSKGLGTGKFDPSIGPGKGFPQRGRTNRNPQKSPEGNGNPGLR